MESWLKNFYGDLLNLGYRVICYFKGQSPKFNSDDEKYPEITLKYPNRDFNSFKKYPVKIGILTDFLGEYKKIITACEDIDISFTIIDFIGDNWIDEILRSDCDGFFFHPTHAPSVSKEMFDERIRIMVDDLSLIVWPRPEDIWIYEGKRRLAYWLTAHHIPHPDTHIFYDRNEARDFLLRSQYPLIYKTHLGSAASGVIILKNYYHAIRILNQAFSKGITRKPGDKRDKSWGYVLFQEFIPDAREFRVIKIGNSWFGHEKIMNLENSFHSGSDLVKWGTPPMDLFDFCNNIAEIGKFPIMCFDVFLSAEGRWLVNELQAAFGSYNPSQMYVDTIDNNDININKPLITGKQIPDSMIPGRYIHSDGKWLFEEGLFNRNGSNNLKVLSFAEYLTQQKSKEPIY